MAITPGQLVWYYTVAGLSREASASGKSLGGMVSTTVIPSGALANVYATIGGTVNKAGLTDYRCVALVNLSALTLSSIKVYLQKIDTRGSTTSIGLDPLGIITNIQGFPVSQQIATGATAPSGVTFSIPTSASPISVAGTLAPNAGFAVWIRRVTSNVAGVNPETNVLAVAGTSPI